jgi:prophage DNA circulation protein
VDQVFGPFEEVVARVELVDKASGTVLGVANCIGRSNTSVNKGVNKKAEGLSKAIAIWIGRSYPKSMKTK